MPSFIQYEIWWHLLFLLQQIKGKKLGQVLDSFKFRKRTNRSQDSITYEKSIFFFLKEKDSHLSLFAVDCNNLKHLI